MGFFDKLSATAISIVVSGNTGVTPFLTLFLVGCIERANPNLLQMEETMENMLASWPSLIFLGIATALEFLSMCIPVVDEIVDSVMTVVIPIMSMIGSLSTFGLLRSVTEEEDDDEGRRLSVGSSALVFFQIVLIGIGIILALSMHMFKMLIRLIGEGWLTNILTVIEASYVITSVTMAVFIKPIAIFVAACIVLVCCYNIKRKYFDKQDEDEDEPGTLVDTASSPAQVASGDGPAATPSTPITAEAKVIPDPEAGEATTDYVQMPASDST